MIRAQIQFDEKQYERIREIAHRNRVSIAEVVRRLVSEGLTGEGFESESNAAAELLKLAGIGSSGIEDLARRHDDYLAEDFDR